MLLTFPDTLTTVRHYQDLNGVDWFHAGDICSILGYANPSDATRNHCLEQVQLFDYQQGRGRSALFVSESGVYMLIMASKSLVAQGFKRWLVFEVLPSIRKTGKYEVKDGDERIFEDVGLQTRYELELLQLEGVKRLRRLMKDDSPAPEAINAASRLLDSCGKAIQGTISSCGSAFSRSPSGSVPVEQDKWLPVVRSHVEDGQNWVSLPDGRVGVVPRGILFRLGVKKPSTGDYRRVGKLLKYLGWSSTANKVQVSGSKTDRVRVWVR